ncbi:MAG: hypothetical protein AAGD25_19810 [Cyanobacteria bacterium P01_F01_bin.150]
MLNAELQKTTNHNHECIAMSNLSDFLTRLLDTVAGTKGLINIEINVDNIKLIDELKLQLAQQIQLTKNIDLSVMISREKQSVQIYPNQNVLSDRSLESLNPHTDFPVSGEKVKLSSIPQLPIKSGTHLIIDQTELWDIDSAFQSHNFKLIPVYTHSPKQFESIHLKSNFVVEFDASLSEKTILISYENEEKLRPNFKSVDREIIYQKLAKMTGKNGDLVPVESITVSRFENQKFFYDSSISDIIISLDEKIESTVSIMYLIEYCNQAHASEYYLIVVKD